MEEHPAAGGVGAADGATGAQGAGEVAHPPSAYAVVIEQGPRNYSAYVPDLPGCIATGTTVEEVTARMTKAIAMHLAAMRRDGDPIPVPVTRVTTVPIEDVA